MTGRWNAAVATLTISTALLLGLLILITAAALPPQEQPAAAQPRRLKPGTVPAEYQPWVEQAGALCPQVSAALIAAQIEAESAWNPRARSRAGAEGIAQFMPATWAAFGADADGDGQSSPLDPPDAIMAMGRYDCYLARELAAVPGPRPDVILAGYNAGPQAVLDHGGVPPFPETQAYIQRITARIRHYGQPDIPAPADGLGGRIVAAATAMLGTPYSWGGGGISGPSAGIGPGRNTVGFDCSGLVQYAVYTASGGRIRLPRTSQQQARSGTPVPREDMQPGDLIAFDRGDGQGYSHIGIYIGDGNMIHAPQTGDVVKVSPLRGRAGQRWAIRRMA